MSEVAADSRSRSVRVLLLEDSDLDAELITEALSRTGLSCAVDRVVSREEFVAAVEADCHDLILADYVLPAFDGLSALAIAHERCPRVPFVFVSGTLGEDVAVEALKHGATDYVTKQRLDRLPRAVVRALAEAQARAERQRAETALRELNAVLERRVTELAVALDEKAQAEEALRESRERLNLAVRTHSIGLYDWHIPSGRVVWNEEEERLFGLEPGAFEGSISGWERRVLPEDLARVQGLMRAAMARRAPELDFDYRIRRADGEIRHMEASGRFLYGPDGTPLHMVGVNIDVTERRRAEDMRRESEQRLRATYEHAFVGIAEVDSSGRFLRVNEQFCVITGYSREELLARAFWQITHRDDREPDLDRFRQQMAGHIATYTMEKRFLHKDGHPVWIELSASTVDDAEGRPLYGIRVVRDITERRRAEEHQRLLINELNHRVKNTLATVQSIALQTFRGGAAERQACQSFEARLLALSRAHDVLTRENWDGAELWAVVAEAVAPHRGVGADRFQIGGPTLRLLPNAALAFSMAFHELCTNAAKYGALSNEIGRIAITWGVADHDDAARLRIRWTERGGPTVRPPTRTGFGSRLIERGIVRELAGQVDLRYEPEGVACLLEVPLGSAVTAGLVALPQSDSDHPALPNLAIH